MRTASHAGSVRALPARAMASLDANPVRALTAMSFLAAGAAFAVGLLAARVAGAQARGEIALALQASYLVWPIAALGMDRLILRGSIEYQPSTRGYLHLAISWATAPAALLLGFAPSSCLAIAAMSALGSHYALARAEGLVTGRIRGYILGQTALQVWLLGSALLLAVYGATGSEGWLAAYTVPGVLVTGAALFRTLRSGMARLRDQWALARRGFVLGFTAAVGWLAFRADRFIIPAMLGTAELGTYVMLAGPLELISVVAVHSADVSVNGLTQGRRVGARRVLASAAVGTAKLLPLVVGAAAFTGLVVLPWLGDEFTSATSLLWPLSLGATVLIMFRLVNAHNLASPRPRSAAIPDAVAGAFAFPAYWIAIDRWGLAGAAIASIAIYALALTVALAVYGYGRRVTNVEQVG